MTKEILEKIKIAVKNSNNITEEKSNRIINMMYQNIWNIFLINFECYQKKQSYSIYLEDELLYFMLLVTDNEYKLLTEKLKNDGFNFKYIQEKDKTLITITRERIKEYANNTTFELTKNR